MNEWELEMDNDKYLLKHFNKKYWAYEAIDISKEAYRKLNNQKKVMFSDAFAGECKHIWESYEAEKATEKENEDMKNETEQKWNFAITDTEEGYFFLQKCSKVMIEDQIEIQHDDFELLETIGCGTENGQLVAARLWEIYKTDAEYHVYALDDYADLSKIIYKLFRNNNEYVEIDKQTYDKLVSMKFQQFDGACEMVWWNAKKKVCDDTESDGKTKNEFLQTFESLYSDGRIHNMTLDYTDKGFNIHLTINKLSSTN